MAVSGEDKRMEGFFKGLIQSAADLEATKAVSEQGRQVISAVGGHVREIMGEVTEVFDLVKNAFKNTMDFFKGLLTDIGGFFGGMVGETRFEVASIKQRDDTIKVMKQTRDATITSAASFDAHFKNLLDEMDTANKIAGEELAQTKKEDLAAGREPGKKKGGIAKIWDVIFGLILSPFMLIAGLIAGFVDVWYRVFTAPLKLLKGLTSFKIVRTVLKPFQLLMAPFKMILKNPIAKAVFGFGKRIGKIFFPLFLIIDGLLGLRKYKEIFGKGAGIREMIESAVAGVVSGFFKLPAKMADWLIEKVTGIETDFASFFDIENIAKHFHGFVDWIKESFVIPIRDFFQSDKWEFIKQETENTINALGMILDKLGNVIRETITFWTEKFQALIDLMFTETEVEKRYRERELAGTAPIDVGLGMGDIGLKYSKKEAEDIQALGATAEERREALAGMRMEQASDQHKEMMDRLDKLIEVSEIYTPSSDMNISNVMSGQGQAHMQGRSPSEQVTGMADVSGLP